MTENEKLAMEMIKTAKELLADNKVTSTKIAGVQHSKQYEFNKAKGVLKIRISSGKLPRIREDQISIHANDVEKKFKTIKQRISNEVVTPSKVVKKDSYVGSIGGKMVAYFTYYGLQFKNLTEDEFYEIIEVLESNDFRFGIE